ncbi:MAG TPA: hypothetical protein VKU42_12470, partial [Candidatus Angelobacter sp.]|nr:hypothetical protein [Candidatus Angelobacter sp.]
PSDSVLQDLQDAVTKQPVEELQAGEAAIEHKRQNRRTEPMSEAELAMALNKARSIAFDVEAFHAQAERDIRMAEDSVNARVQ